MREATVGRVRFLMLAAILALQTAFVVQIARVQERQLEIVRAQQADRERELAHEIATRDAVNERRLGVVRETLVETVKQMDLGEKREKQLLRRIRDAFAAAAVPPTREAPPPPPGEAPGGGGNPPPPQPSPPGPPSPSPPCEEVGNSGVCPPGLN